MAGCVGSLYLPLFWFAAHHRFFASLVKQMTGFLVFHENSHYMGEHSSKVSSAAANENCHKTKRQLTASESGSQLDPPS